MKIYAFLFFFLNSFIVLLCVASQCTRCFLTNPYALNLASFTVACAEPSLPGSASVLHANTSVFYKQVFKLTFILNIPFTVASLFIPSFKLKTPGYSFISSFF